jgi:hypothetical protein
VLGKFAGEFSNTTSIYAGTGTLQKAGDGVARASRNPVKMSAFKRGAKSSDRQLWAHSSHNSLVDQFLLLANARFDSV